MSWLNFIKAVFRGEHKLAPITWVTLIVGLLYTLSPFDFIPEIILGPLGLLDDAGVIAVMLALAAREKSRYEVTGSPIDVKAERLS